MTRVACASSPTPFVLEFARTKLALLLVHRADAFGFVCSSSALLGLL